MPPGARAALLFAALVLAPVAAPVLAQGDAPGGGGDLPATRFEPQPPELRALAAEWLRQERDLLAAFEATHPGADTAVMRVFLEGGSDFLNESRILLATSQFVQVEVQAKFQDFFPPLAPEDRRARSLERVETEARGTRALLERFLANLSAYEDRTRTTHGLEVALFATQLGIIADSFLRNAPNETERLRTAPEAEERIVRSTLLVNAAGQSYARWADELLSLAARIDAEAGRPPLPADALDTLVAAVETRLREDPDALSVTGARSSEGQGLLNEARRAGDRLLYLGRFLAFEQGRSADAIDFLRQRGSLSDAVLAGNLRLVVENQSFAARYDGRPELHTFPPLLDRMRSTGYQGVLQADALNHALYRLAWDQSYQGTASAWTQMVSVRYATDMLVAAPSPQRAQDAGSGDLLLYGGIAVASALAVAAFALLRKPSS